MYFDCIVSWSWLGATTELLLHLLISLASISKPCLIITDIFSIMMMMKCPSWLVVSSCCCCSPPLWPSWTVTVVTWRSQSNMFFLMKSAMYTSEHGTTACVNIMWTLVLYIVISFLKLTVLKFCLILQFTCTNSNVWFLCFDRWNKPGMDDMHDKQHHHRDGSPVHHLSDHHEQVWWCQWASSSSDLLMLSTDISNQSSCYVDVTLQASNINCWW